MSDAFDDFDRPAAPATAAADIDTEALLRRVVEIVNNAKSMPLSASVLISKEEVVELLEEALNRLPEELRQARWMLKEREDFLAKTQREADEILDAARVRAERMVQRTEIVRAAQQTAKRTVEQAEDEARRLKHEADDYCDQKLAAFEIVLERTMKTVQAGRDKLGVTRTPPVPQAVDEGPVDDAFFDQDVD